MREEDKTKGSVIYSALNNSTEYQQLTKDFDPRVVDLTVAGLKASGQWSGSYRDVNVFLSKIGQDIQDGDTVAQEALDLLTRTNTAINPITYENARNAVSQ
jgi:gamma-glutamylcysteine synthetase